MKKQPKYTQRVFRLTLLMTMLFSLPIMADDTPPEFEEDVDDEPTVPIDGNYLVLALVAGAYLGIRKLRAGENVVK